MTAVPEYQGNRPYQFMCFQWSAHIQKSKNGEIVHKEYLAKEGTADLYIRVKKIVIVCILLTLKCIQITCSLLLARVPLVNIVKNIFFIN